MRPFVNSGSDIPQSLAGFDHRPLRFVYAYQLYYVTTVIWNSGPIMGTSYLAWGTSQWTDMGGGGEDNLAVPRFLQRLPAL
jgi:hypothetical protein